MATAKRIAKNTFFLVSSQLVQKAFGFLLILFLARFLTIQDFGIYSFVFSFIVMFNVIADAGLSSFLVREIAKDRQSTAKLLGSSALIKVFLSIAAMALLYCAIVLLKYDSFTVNLVVLAGISMVLDSMAGLFRSVFFATERMGYDFLVNTIQKAFILAASIFALLAGYGIFGLVLVMVAASLVSLFLSFGIVFFLFARPVVEKNPGFYKMLFFSALPFCFIGFFMSLYSNLDVAMLSFFHKGSPEFVAYYSAATRLINTLSLVSVSFSAAIFPVLTKFFSQGSKSISLVVEKSLNYLLIVILPVAFGTTILSERILDLFFPDSKFAPGGSALRILVWFCAISFMNMVWMSTLNSVNREKSSARFVAITLGLNVVLNFFLIPRYNFIGAAIATVVSGTVHFALNYFEVSRAIGHISLFKVVKKPFIAGTAMALLVFFLQPLNILALIPIAAIFYFAVLLLLKGFSEEDKKILLRALKLENNNSNGFSQDNG